jgi:hypothetical protein
MEGLKLNVHLAHSVKLVHGAGQIARVSLDTGGLLVSSTTFSSWSGVVSFFKLTLGDFQADLASCAAKESTITYLDAEPARIQ